MIAPRKTLTRHSNSWIPFTIIVTASLVFYFLIAFFTSPQLDDLHYAYPYRHWLLGEGEFPGVEPWMKTIRAHFYGINGRLGDKLLIGYILLPKWISATITSLCTVGFMVLAAFVATGSLRRYALLSTAIVVALILSLPWYDTMFLNCMVVNYILAAFFGMTALAVYFRSPERISRHKYLKYTAALFAGFLAGSWHECFTFIIAPGLLIYPFFVKRINGMQRAVLAGGILGGIFIVCNPGFWHRYDNQMYLMTMKDAVWVLYYANLSLSFLILYPIFMLTKRLRRRYTRVELGIMTTCSIAMILNILIFISNLSLPRVLWFGIITGYIGLGVTLRPFNPGKKLRTISTIAVWGGIVFCLAHFAAAAFQQYKIDKEYKHVIELYRTSMDGTVFFTEKSSKDVSFLALNRPFYDQFRGWHIDAGTDMFYRKSGEYLQLVPAELKGFAPEKAEILNRDQGIYLYKGCCVVDAEVTPYSRSHKLITTAADGTRDSEWAICHRFKTADGHVWYYIDTTDCESLESPSIR